MYLIQNKNKGDEGGGEIPKIGVNCQNMCFYTILGINKGVLGFVSALKGC